MNIPFELFIAGIAICVFLAILGFMSKNKNAGMFTVIGGLVMFILIALTQNHIMGYATGSETTYNNVTETLHQIVKPSEPILEPFIAENKVFWGVASAILMLMGALIMRSEN